MPNFDVEIRRTHLDVAGLVLSCPADQAVLDGSGNVMEWRNIAPTVQPGSTDPRFENLIQSTPANRPDYATPFGIPLVVFERANSHYMDIIRNAGTWTNVDKWTVAIGGAIGTDSSNGQDLLSLPNLEIVRRNSFGNKAYIYNSTERAGSGDVASDPLVIVFKGSSGADWYEAGVLDYSNTCADIDLTGDGTVCRDYTSGDYADYAMAGIYIWKRELAPYEIDFIFRTIDPFNDDSQYDWATVALNVWRDDTNSPPRINPIIGADHRYYHVSVPAGTQRFIQIAARVDGTIKPDSELGGNLFTADWVERPVGSVLPYIIQDTGYSAIYNIRLEDEGHYTFQIFRNNGGSVIVHFDVEET